MKTQTAKKFNSYKDLIEFGKNCYFNKQDIITEIKYENGNMSAFEKSKDGTVGNQLFEYSVEPALQNIFENMFSLESSLTIYTDNTNHFQFICNYLVLDLILTSKMLKSQNKPLNNKFKLKCKNGKIRDIVAPCDDIKCILKGMNKIFQAVYDKRNADFQVAYKCGKNIKSNAINHKNMKNIFKIDLHDFFPSCKREYVNKIVSFLFKNSLNPDYIKNLFLEDILENDALFIGSPISGTLANAIISKPVFYIKNICNKFNISFSVYADDMTFGSEKYLDKKFIIGIFNRAFTRFDMERDFMLNEKKCFGQSGCNRSVTGVVVNGNNELTAHRHIYNDIRQTLHQLSYGDESHLSYNKLKGKISFMSMIDESGKLKRLLEKYKDVVLSYKLVSLDKLRSLGIN